MEQKIGIIGTGWVADAHLEALRKIPGAHVAAVAGKNGEKAAKLAAAAGGRGYADYQSMLENETLDAVFILLPPHVHGEVEKACAARVPAVFVEKPVSNNLETAREVQKAFADAGTIVATGYMMRYLPAVNRAQALFAQAQDKPALISGRWVNPMAGPLWWRDSAQSGGQFVEQCTHLVDAARYIAGEIVRVSAVSAKGFVRDVERYDTEDALAVHAAFASGAAGSFTTGCFPRNFDAEIGLTVESRSLQCHFSGWGMELQIDHGDGWTERVAPIDGEVFVLEDAAFLRAAAAKDPSGILSTYESALETLRVTLAATESARTGKIVSL